MKIKIGIYQHKVKNEPLLKKMPYLKDIQF